MGTYREITMKKVYKVMRITNSGLSLSSENMTVKLPKEIRDCGLPRRINFFVGFEKDGYGCEFKFVYEKKFFCVYAEELNTYWRPITHRIIPLKEQTNEISF